MTGVVVSGTPYGARNDYQYDSLSRVTQAKQGVPNVATYVRTVDFTYTSTGQFATITRTSVLSGTPTAAGTSTYSYNDLGRLESLVHKDPSLNVLAEYEWEYDAKGQVTEFTSTNTADGTTTYNYDATGQLITADYTSNIPDEEYVYDLNGNRAYGGYKTGPGNQLLEDGTFEYVYDYEGNRRFKQRLSSASADDYRVEYVWDYRQRLTDVIFKNNSGTVTKSVHYDYDVFDRRIAKTLDSDGEATGVAVTKTFTVYDDDDVLFDFLDADTSTPNDAVLKKRYLHGPAVDQILSEQDATTWGVTYHLADNLGTVRDLTGYNGNLVTHVRYDAFGQIIDETNTGWSNRYKFTGREFDKDTGLQYNRARWYDPAVGRWLNPDPIGFEAGDANLYRYVENAPMNYVDPSGLIKRPIVFSGAVNLNYIDPALKRDHPGPMGPWEAYLDINHTRKVVYSKRAEQRGFVAEQRPGIKTVLSSRFLGTQSTPPDLATGQNWGMLAVYEVTYEIHNYQDVYLNWRVTTHMQEYAFRCKYDEVLRRRIEWWDRYGPSKTSESYHLQYLGTIDTVVGTVTEPYSILLPTFSIPGEPGPRRFPK